MIPFRRTIEHGSRGPDVEGVKLALEHAGETGFTLSAYFGLYAAKALARFQAAHRLVADGIYGPATHAKLEPYFTAAARDLYLKAAPTLQLPYGVTRHGEVWFIFPDGRQLKNTHPTSGLPGYPAFDVLAKAGTIALAPEAGTIQKLSGHEPSGHAKAGSAYGLSCYLRRAKGPGRYFLTHYGDLFVHVGQTVKKGTPLGPLVDFEAATGGVTPSHVHEGYDPSYS